MDVFQKCRDALNVLAKWRTVFAGWQLGTRPMSDGPSKALRDHREVTLLMRAELNALTVLLVKKGIFTSEEFHAQLTEDAQELCKLLEKRFPGFKASETGMILTKEAAETMKRLNFPP